MIWGGIVENTKKKWYTIAYVICIILLIVNLPFNYLIKNESILSLINIACKILAIFIFFILIKKEKLHKIKLNGFCSKHLLFFPFLIACSSNIIVGLINNEYSDINTHNLIIDLFTCIFTAVIEELLFRELLLKELNFHYNPVKSIIITSLIFGSIHLLNINSFASIPICLLQAGYTSLLGLMLGLIYLASKNIIYPIFFHFTFNFLNDSLSTNIFNLKWNSTFFIVNISISLIILMYGIYIYYIFKKEMTSNASTNMDF